MTRSRTSRSRTLLAGSWAIVLGAAGPLLASQDPAAPPAALPLTQDEAVRVALRQNPTLAMARSERNIGLLNADRNRPALRPEVNVSASQFVNSQRVSLPGRFDEVVIPNSLSRFEVSLRQPLYQFGAGRAPGQRADAMAGAARSDYRTAELDLVLQVREAYLEAARAQALAGVAERGVELARAHLAVTNAAIEAGLQAEVSRLEAERDMAQAETRLRQARNGITLALGNVNRLLARPVDAPVELTPLGALPGDPPPLSELLPRALSQRSEVQALRRNMEVAEAGIRLAKASRLPRVELQAAYGLQTPTALVPQSAVTAGVVLTAPIFDGASRRYTIAEAEERLTQLRSGMTALEQGIALELQRQVLAVGQARADREAAERAITAAEKTYEVTRLRYELGRAVPAEVLNARLLLERALGDRVDAEHALRLAQTRLDRALGEGPASEEGSESGVPGKIKD